MIIQCPANKRLQSHLLENGIHIHTACGCRGNCGRCLVKVIEGTAAINTMDREWFSEEQLAQGYRLGCQVFAKEPLTIEITDSLEKADSKL